jgi:hypothetical protein
VKNNQEGIFGKCVETFKAKRLPGNCGILEPAGPFPEDGRVGCNDEDCEDAVCSFDEFCCGEFDGWWDRICIGYAGTFCEKATGPPN